MRSHLLAVLTLVQFGCGGGSSKVATAHSQPRDVSCGIDNVRTIAERGVGQLAIGNSVDSVKRHCTILSDSEVQDAEAIPRRQLLVLAGSDSLVVTVDGDRISSITIRGPTLRTSDSLGVGSSISRVLTSGTASGFVGEDELFVMTSEHCGMSFLTDYKPREVDARRRWTDKDLMQVPTQTKIVAVQVFGCHDLH